MRLPRPCHVLLAALPLLAGGCATLHRSHNPLVAAGFVSRPANTPARQDMLVRLPPHVFVEHAHGRTRAYAYADPAGCDCLYLGGTHAYRRYLRQTARPGGAGPVAGFTDGHWDWDAWRPNLPGFQWGPALGW